MGKIIATCCHEITVEWMSDDRSRVHVRTYDTHGNPAVSLEVLCEDCLRSREADGVVLKDESEVDEYLGLTAPISPACRDMTPVIDADEDGTPVVDFLADDDFLLRMSVQSAREMAKRILDITES